ncbi:hypothetical protein ABN763_10110 [Spongiivirga sp. MCCC 1A20706]|uniref:hypothetical protein n=1 Tax=Spongiivirga sp. MCCC 1A20706 TaxID=3160963 RepID=UPI003977D811
MKKLFKVIIFCMFQLNLSYGNSALVSEKENLGVVYVDPATAIAIAQTAVQVWQALGPKDQSISQIMNMLQTIDSKLDIINEKMDIVIEELQNLDKKTYLFFKTAEGEVLLKSMITFDRALFEEIKDLPSSLRSQQKKRFIINEEQRLKEYSDRLHDVFLHLQKFGERPEIASYISVSFQLENRIYEKLIFANSNVLPKSLMQSRQDNYLDFFSKTIVQLENRLEKLKKEGPESDKNKIASVLNLTNHGNGKWTRNKSGVTFIKTHRTNEGRRGRVFDYHEIIWHYFTLEQTEWLKSEDLDNLRFELGYEFDDWFYGFNMNVTVSTQKGENYKKKKPGDWKSADHDFLPSVNSEIQTNLPKILKPRRDKLLLLCYSIENVSKSLFNIQKNEESQLYSN